MGNFFQRLAGIDNKKVNIDKTNDINKGRELKRALEDEIDSRIEEDKENEWIDGDYEEGQLSIDVYQTPKKIIIKSTIAGVKPEDIDISINNDMLTIRGKREGGEEIEEDNYLYKECYWGTFSRSIILPVEVEANKIEAVLENGVLTITLPKAKTAKQISVKVKEG
ncbi:MAG: Hsp20/alpha crystallin family protein [Patescibacteria group bacterium]